MASVPLLTELPETEAERTSSASAAIAAGETRSAFQISPGSALLVSVIVINYNGAHWLERCLTSLRRQTIAGQIEIILADNASRDQSEELARALLGDWPRARVVGLGANLGYSGGNNRAANLAGGRYLLFLNNDTWLEPDCLELLLKEALKSDATVATPLVLDYLDGEIQSSGARGFDIFGLSSGLADWSKGREIFVASGCSLLIKTDWFRKLGGFDSRFFMYADEYDLCWRAWMAGGKVMLAPSARVHHRGAAAINPLGGPEVLENRTSDTKRFYANRNSLLVLLKNCQHLLLVTVPLQLMLLLLEGLVMGVVARRWSHLRRGYLDAVWDCWHLRGYIAAQRRELRRLRRRGDLWMLRFLRAQFNRWREFQRLLRFGMPKVDPK